MKFGSTLFFWVLLFLLFHRCNDVPMSLVVTVDDVSASRQPVDMDVEFKVSIPHVSTSDASIDYATKDGTASAGIDFTAASGTAIIPAGSLFATIKIKVIADSLRKDFQVFYLELTNPINCTLANTVATGKIQNGDGLYLPVDDAGYRTPDAYPNYALVWSDEFNDNAIDKSNWTYETIDIGGNGWGTHELEKYTDQTKNAFVSSGNLIIEGRKDLTSARLTTKGKRNFKYGRIDIRAKLPCSQGIMSSLRMMGANVDTEGWPACGEIDMAQLPHTENIMYNTVHWMDLQHMPQQLGRNQSLGTVDNKFHVFTLVWDEREILMYLDDNLSFQMNTDGVSLPFNNDFFFIFNVAIGGDWPGSPDNSTQFPQRLVVDYVRVFQ